MVIMACVAGKASAAERPFVLWRKDDIAGIRERIETQGWAKAAYEKLISNAGRNFGGTGWNWSADSSIIPYYSSSV